MWRARPHDRDHDELASLQLLVDGVTELLGYRRAGISLVDGDELVVAVVAGEEAGPDAGEAIGVRRPRAAVEALLERGTPLGGFVLAPCPDAGDRLMAPLRAADGALVGVLTIDGTAEGRHADPGVQRLLADWAAYANRIVLDTLERGTLARKAALLDHLRDVMSTLTETLDPHALVTRAHSGVLAAFEADAVLLQTFRDAPDSGSDISTVAGTLPGTGSAGVPLVERLARGAWQRRELLEFEAGRLETDPGLQPYLGPITAWLERTGTRSVLFSPIGAGDEALGSLLITRGAGRPGWSALEREAALELSSDMGRVLRTARAYRREQEVARELQRLDRYQHDLIATVSHELKNPLSVIIGNAELLADGVAHAAVPDRRGLNAIQRATQRMSRVVDDLLLLSRVADPDHRTEPQDVDLGELTARIAATVEPVAAGRGQHMAVRVTPPVGVRGKAVELERVVQALLSNAVSYTPDGGRIVASVRRGRAGVELTVSDTGIGIGVEHLGRVREEFYRVPDPEVLAHAGTGLGLAIVDRIVRRHGGTLEIESTPGQGSTFRVTLPAAPTD